MLKLYILLLVFIISCGTQKENTSFINETMNERNNPQHIFGATTDLEYVYKKLPSYGTSQRLWRGSWWPLSEKGTASTRYGFPSPLRKYDLATGSKSEAWELNDAETYAHIGWAGHCNGVAAAGIMMEEPKHSVLYNNVWFTITDIKALITEMWQGSGSIVGTRCKDGKYDKYNRRVDSECRDVNPATFHIALTNYLGIFGKSIIGDKDASSAVWNYPIQSYTIIEKRWLQKSEAIFRLKNESSTLYAYNTDAVYFVYIKNSIIFLGFDSKEYEYILELDDKEKIIGGEWVGKSKIEHPDFIWRPLDPKLENPELNIEIIQNIYKQSI